MRTVTGWFGGIAIAVVIFLSPLDLTAQSGTTTAETGTGASKSAVDTATSSSPAQTATADTATNNAGDILPSSATSTATTPQQGEVSKLHLGFELETEAWLLPVIVFVVSVFLGLVLHNLLLSHDIRHWPHSSGSWLKLRVFPFLVGLLLMLAAYFYFVHGLDDEILRLVRVRIGFTSVICAFALLAFWLFLPRPSVENTRTNYEAGA